MEEKNNIHFLSNKDYYSYSIIVFLFLLGLYLPREVVKENAEVLSWVGGGIGGMIGFVVAYQIREKNNEFKLWVLLSVIILFGTTIYIITDNKGNPRLKKVLIGEWQTDNMEDIIFYIKVTPDFIEGSMISANYYTEKYDYKLRDNNLIISQENMVVFDWTVNVIDNNTLEIINGYDYIIFYRRF